MMEKSSQFLSSEQPEPKIKFGCCLEYCRSSSSKNTLRRPILRLVSLNCQVRLLESYSKKKRLFLTFSYEITNSQCNQLPVGLTAQLVEHCSAIAEVMGSNPVHAWIFFKLFFHNCLVVYITAMVIFLRSSNIWSFMYSFIYKDR